MEMLELIKKLPDEIEEALDFELPEYSNVDHIIFGGMGGSGISGDLVASYFFDAKIPLFSVHDYNLPGFAGERTLVIVTSYSGNTEEALSIYKMARDRGCKILAISSDGKLKDSAERDGVPYVKIPQGFPPRTALGWLFVPSFLTVARIVTGDDSTFREELKETATFLRSLQKDFEDIDSLAHDLANKFYLRIPVVYSSSRFYPTIFRWKTQINENAKAFAHVAELPEMDHNEITGLIEPEDLVEYLWVVFIEDRDDNERVKLRIKETEDLIKDSVMGTTIVKTEGDTLLKRMFFTIYLGDYISYFLEVNYNQDPISIPRIDELKRRLSK